MSAIDLVSGAVASLYACVWLVYSGIETRGLFVRSLFFFGAFGWLYTAAKLVVGAAS